MKLFWALLLLTLVYLLCIWALAFETQARRATVQRVYRATSQGQSTVYVRIRYWSGYEETLDAVTYIQGVLPAEMPALWPEEALRAQAVVSLSYALSGGPVPTWTKGQVYDPAKRHERTDRIAQEMAGIVMVTEDGGGIARAFYHASCGGQTHNTWAPDYTKDVECVCGRKKHGHGQGMCQYGARELAERGYSWQEIINYYFDVELRRDYGSALLDGSANE